EAFEVFAENADGSPKTDLTPMTRWRGLIMDHYGQGRWIHPGHQLTFIMQSRPQTDLPDLGPNQFFITYHIDTGRSHGLFLAEPIVVLPIKNQSEVIMPYASRTLGGRPSIGTGLFQYQQREDMTRPVVPHEPIQVTYQQVTLSLPGDGLSRPSPLSPEKQEATQMEKSLTGELLEQPIKGIRDFTKEVLNRIVQEGKLTDKELRRVKPSKGADPESQPLIRVNRAKVARALSDYLQFSGEYSYSLNLSRQDLRLDPTEDFLRNVKD